MAQLRSADGTSIAYDTLGGGPAVVLLYVGPFTRASNTGLATLLAEQFTVYVYDRRGRGESGGEVTDGPEREFEDLDAVLELAGGSAHVYGSSGGAIMALQGVARGLPITRLGLWEPPFDSPVPANWGQQVAERVDAGKRGDGVAYWMTQVVGMPAEMVEGMRGAPFWAATEAQAHGLIADAAITGSLRFPDNLAAVEAPALVMDGGSASPPLMRAATAKVVATLPNATHKTLDGQPHNVSDEAMAPALAEFFG